MGLSICYIVAFSTFLCCIHSQRYIVPEATLQFLNPRGLRISIPDDDPEIKLVAFHINKNEEFEGIEHGHFAADITKKRDGRWSYTIPDFRVKQGDIIYYWIHVIVDRLGYNGLDREYRVTQANPHGSGTTITTDTGTGLPRPTTQSPSCIPSQTNRDGVTIPACQGEVLLDKKFYNMDGWDHRVTIGGSAPEEEFVVFTKDPTNSWLENGKLVIKPTLLEDKSNDSFVRSGELLLEGCTSNVAEECVRQAHHYLILPPIVSARLSTKKKFSFRFGTVEIRAKLPRGNWIVPELWLDPVNGPPTERVVMGLSRGNTDDSEYGWRTLEAGVMGDTQSSLGKNTQGTPWSQDFHTFKVVWTPDQMTFIVDSKEIHRIPAVNFSILCKEVYITLGVHVAGNRDFPDNINSKPWKNSDPKRFARFWDAKSSWFPTWNQDSTLQVEYIKVTAA